MDLMQSQSNSAICFPINSRVIPELQNTKLRLPLNRNSPEPCTSLTEDGIGNAWKNTNTKFTEKDSRSDCDLREDTDFTPYNDCFYHNFCINIARQKMSWNYNIQKRPSFARKYILTYPIPCMKVFKCLFLFQWRPLLKLLELFACTSMLPAIFLPFSSTLTETFRRKYSPVVFNFYQAA